MADDKIPGTGETPAPEARVPETPAPPAAEQGVIPGVTDPPAPEVTDPPAGPTPKGQSLEDDDRQEWEIPSAELEARKQKPKRGRTPKTEKGQDTPGQGKRAAPGKGGPSAPGKTGRTPKPAAKAGPVTENPPAPTVDPPAPRDASSGACTEGRFFCAVQFFSEIAPRRGRPSYTPAKT